ncbi:MAG TPA: hypothetical protein VEI02_02385 [Planctomycetota bacterium]|nr:hypothetical protein [Planctomycetota bacterium]
MSSRGRLNARILLDLMSEAEELTARLRLLKRSSERRRVGARRLKLLRRLRGAVSRPGDSFRSALLGLSEAASLDRDERLLILALFVRRLRKPQPPIQGRDLLEWVSSRPARDDLAGRARVLHPDGRLVSGGFVHTDAYAPEHVFDAGFRLNDEVFKLLYRAFHGLVFDPNASESRRPTPFASWSDHLLAYRALTELAKRRAAKLFPLSGWAEVFSDEERPADELGRLFDVQAALLRAREEATSEAVRLPIVELRHQHRLTADEELILVTLLLQEFYAARATIELGELLRLVARGEEDLLKRRALIGAAGKLREAGLLVVEGEAEGKDLLASAWLPPWLGERLLGAGDAARAIGEEERSKFHAYLQNLESSEDFYRRL